MKLLNNLNDLLSPWIKNVPFVLLKKITLDSRNVTKKNLFIAIKGNIVHGKKFILDAMKNGASAVLVETSNVKNHGKINNIKNIPIIYFFHLNKHLSTIAGRFYGNPGRTLKIIGVTGTNGKTTVTHLIAQWADLLGNKTAIIGTLGNGLYNNLVTTKNTTDSASDIQLCLYKFLQSKVNIVAIEISSHGIKQHRTKDVPFSIGILTNISQDHLDYHHNTKKYVKEKWNFFKTHSIQQNIFNYNNLLTNDWCNKITFNKDILVGIHINPYSKYSQKWINAKKIIYNKNNIQILFESYWGNGILTSNLLGRLNIINLLLAFSSLLKLGYPINLLTETSKFLTPVQGRMQKIHKKGMPMIIIDYAHTPDALKQALQSLRYYCKNTLWCIFGCGGDRDKTKRSIMGMIAEKFSDKVIVTNDNPRNENPITIIKEIIKNCTQKVIYILNREEAIQYAINHSTTNDIILVAGKGNEQYQIIGRKVLNVSDKQIVYKILKR